MKKNFLLILLLSATCAFAYDFTASDVNGNTIYYTKLGGDSVEVSNNGSNGTYSGNIVVPDNVLDGTSKYRVTTIGASAFNSCTLSSLDLPHSIQEIKGSAFNNAHVPGELYLPNLRTLGGYAFRLCWSLKKVHFPNLKQVGGLAIADCYNLEEIILSDDIEAIGNWCFDSDIMLKNMRLPKKMKTIPDRCFRACWRLRHVTLPDSVESIGNDAFIGCIWLNTITIPKKVKSIGNTFICGTAQTYWGGAWSETTIDGLYPQSNSSNQLQSIYFEGTTPPQVTSTTFANIIKDNVTCYVPFEALDAYKADSLYVKAFADIRGYHVGASEVGDITESTATLKWLRDSSVVEYTISIFTTNKSLYAQYKVDSDGNATEVPLSLPNKIRKDSTSSSTDFFVLTIKNLTIKTSYIYEIIGVDRNSEQVYHEMGSFRTVDPYEALEPIEADDPQRTTRKILLDGQILIIRGEKYFDLRGQEVKSMSNASK